MNWDLARLWHHLARSEPQRPALIHGEKTLTWEQFDAAAAGGAEILRRGGVRPGDVVVLCLPNVIEYLVVVAAVLRCGAVPCGINYRYRLGELATLLRHLDPAVVCYTPGRCADMRQLRDRLPAVKRWYPVGDGTGRTGLSVHQMSAADGDTARVDSSPDDVLIKCTGGTTGVPIAVRWRVADVLTQLNDHNPWHRHDLAGSTVTAPEDPIRLLVASPLMHGSGLNRAFGALCAGGTVITMPPRGFNAADLLDAAERHRAGSLAIVGDAHALPIADTLDARLRRWQLPDLDTVTSSGAAWTRDVKQRLLVQLPHLRLLESFGATEATGLGFSVATAGRIPPTGEFELGRHAIVVTGRRSTRPGQTGTIGVRWPHPIGVHPDGQIPADRFIDYHGGRYLLSGDHVRLLDQARFQMLGRAADCINTGGEKVYAPEVAELLLSHPGVRDAVVVGIPDARLGHTIAAVLAMAPGTAPDTIRSYAREHLAGYKVPTVIVFVPAVPRTAAGKPDLISAAALAVRHAGVAA
jgi:acyl-CoA synthetase (AMP-forming)/AMP-acid ligase II